MHFVTLLVQTGEALAVQPHPRSLSKSKAQAPKSITRADFITAI